MAVRERIGCPVCGMNRGPVFFGIDQSTGVYDPAARPPKTVLHRCQFGGRARITVETTGLPLHLAQGLRSALRASLALVEREILEAGGELSDDD